MADVLTATKIGTCIELLRKNWDLINLDLFGKSFGPPFILYLTTLSILYCASVVAQVSGFLNHYFVARLVYHKIIGSSDKWKLKVLINMVNVSC